MNYLQLLDNGVDVSESQWTNPKPHPNFKNILSVEIADKEYWVGRKTLVAMKTAKASGSEIDLVATLIPGDNGAKNRWVVDTKSLENNKLGTQKG